MPRVPDADGAPGRSDMEAFSSSKSGVNAFGLRSASSRVYSTAAAVFLEMNSWRGGRLSSSAWGALGSARDSDAARLRSTGICWERLLVSDESAGCWSSSESLGTTSSSRQSGAYGDITRPKRLVRLKLGLSLTSLEVDR